MGWVTDRTLLTNLRRLADHLGAFLGPSAEVIVHDLRDLNHSAVYVVGDVTHRTVGSPMTDLGLAILRRGPADTPDLRRYATTASDGRRLKSSTTFIRNADGEAIAAFCINLDLTGWMQAPPILQEFVDVQPLEHIQERFEPTVPDLMAAMLAEVLAGRQPNHMDIGDRVNCIKALDDKGVFLVRGAADYVAAVLGISRATVYSYLQRIRAHEEFAVAERK